MRAFRAPLGVGRKIYSSSSLIDADSQRFREDIVDRESNLGSIQDF